MFEGGFAIHDGASLVRTVFAADDDSTAPDGRQNLVLFFENADLGGAFARRSLHVPLIHEIRQEPRAGTPGRNRGVGVSFARSPRTAM